MTTDRQELERFLRWWISYWGRHHNLNDPAERDRSITDGLDEYINHQNTHRRSEGPLCPDCGYTHPDTAHRTTP